MDAIMEILVLAILALLLLSVTLVAIMTFFKALPEIKKDWRKFKET